MPDSRLTDEMIERVRTLHRRRLLRGWRKIGLLAPEQTLWAKYGYCASCRVTWPCTTAEVVGLAAARGSAAATEDSES